MTAKVELKHSEVAIEEGPDSTRRELGNWCEPFRWKKGHGSDARDDSDGDPDTFATHPSGNVLVN